MLAENRQFNILHLHFMPSMGLPHSNFIKIFATSKLEYLGYCVVYLASQEN